MDQSVLSAQDLAHFDQWGFVRVPQALSEAFVERVRSVVWREMETLYGMRETLPSTWRPEWCGVNKDKIDGAARPRTTERLSGAIDQLLGAGQWRPIRTYGGLLMTMPEADGSVWEVVRKAWHFDNDPRAYPTGADELMLFTFYSLVEAQGGGTLVLAGSHRLAEAFLPTSAAAGHTGNDLLTAFWTWHPFLAQLQGPHARENADAFRVGAVTEVHGVSVRIVEFTGEPGDAILCHPALAHATSRNGSDRPRIMRRTNVRRQRSA